MESRGKVFPWRTITWLTCFAAVFAIVGWQVFKRDYITAIEYILIFAISVASSRGHFKPLPPQPWPRLLGITLLCIVGFAVLCVVLGVLYYGVFKGQ